MLLASCATPQERAINHHCSALASNQVPERIAIQEVLRQVKVGDRITGYRERCTVTKSKRTEKDKDGKEREIWTEDKVCHQVPTDGQAHAIIEQTEAASKPEQLACSAS